MNYIKNKLVPKIRFSEFNDDWDEDQLSGLLDYERPDNYIVKDTNYSLQGTPVLTANKSFILGYTQETDGICDNIPVILFDDFTTDKKYVDFPFKVKSSAIKILRAKEDNNLRFIHELMSIIRFEAKEHKRYYISTYQNLLVPVPKPVEQQKIVDCLSSLDDLINAENQKLEVLKAHKKGLMQNLFPAEGEKVPKLRFKEFESNGKWVSQSFIQMYKLIPTNSYSRDQLNYEMGRIRNIHYGDIHTKFSTLFDITKEEVPYVNSSISLDNINIDYFCNESDMVFADASEDLKDVGKSIEIVNVNSEKILSGMHTILARQREPKLIIGFGGYLFLSNRIRIQIQKEAQGTKVFGISGNRLSNIEICYPKDQKEQQKIVDSISSLDKLVTAQSQKTDALKKHKKGLLLNLFPYFKEI